MLTVETLAGFALSHEDPFFYEAKALLRKRFPRAAMIEIAENTVTIVQCHSEQDAVLRLSVQTGLPFGEVMDQMAQDRRVTH